VRSGPWPQSWPGTAYWVSNPFGIRGSRRGGLRQPPTANSSFSRITLSGSICGDSDSRPGVIAWRNSLISVRQSSSVRSRGHSASSGSQQVIGSIPSSFPLCDGLTRKHNTVAKKADEGHDNVSDQLTAVRFRSPPCRYYGFRRPNRRGALTSREQ